MTAAVATSRAIIVFRVHVVVQAWKRHLQQDQKNTSKIFEIRHTDAHAIKHTPSQLIVESFSVSNYCSCLCRLFVDKAEKSPSFLDDLKRELAEIQSKAQ